MKTREEKVDNKHIRNLKKQISKLKKENAQLRKKNMRLESELSRDLDELDGDSMAEFENSTPKERFTCHNCGSYSIEEFTAGAYEFYSCNSCNVQKLKNPNKKAC